MLHGRGARTVRLGIIPAFVRVSGRRIRVKKKFFDDWVSSRCAAGKTDGTPVLKRLHCFFK